MSACVSPAARRASASCRWCGVILWDLPNRTPRAARGVVLELLGQSCTHRAQNADSSKKVPKPRPAGFSAISCRPPDAETNGSARRFIGGLPPMSVPFRASSLLGSTVGGKSFWEVSEQAT